MSHFTVLVIGDDVTDQLAPFHEYESTGRQDEFVIEVDVTDEVVAHFNEARDLVRLADGTYLSRYSAALYTGEPKHRHGDKTFVLPPGAEERADVPAEEARSHGIGPLTLDDAARDYYGENVVIRDGAYFKLTNPQAKWDWWQVGGRWTGSLKLKPGRPGVVGKPGLGADPCPPGYADSARKGDVDFDQLRNDAEVKARALWNDTRRITGGLGWDSWDDTLTRYCGPEDDQGERDRSHLETAQREYRDQPGVALLKASGLSVYSWEIDDDLALDCEVYVKRRRDLACVQHAFIRDKTWVEQGEMGWFGVSHDDVSASQWAKRFNEMLDGLPDDTLLTVVDCHI